MSQSPPHAQVHYLKSFFPPAVSLFPLTSSLFPSISHFLPLPPPTPPTRRIRVVVRRVHPHCLVTSPPPVPPSSHLPELEHIHHFLQPQHISRPRPPHRGGAALLFHRDKVVSGAYLNDPGGRPWRCCSCVISASVVMER